MKPSCAPTDYELTGLPLVWYPGLVFLRLKQLDRIAQRATVTGRSTIPRTGPDDAVMAYARECGITWATSWRTRYRSRSLIICPQCKALAWRLIESEEGAWQCRVCHPWPSTRTELLLAEYLFGVRIGLRGMAMKQRRKRLLLRLRDQVRRVRSPLELVRLAEGAALVGARIEHSRLGLKGWVRAPSPAARLAGGPIWKSASHHLIPAMIDSLLHPMAYQARYGARRLAA